MTKTYVVYLKNGEVLDLGAHKKDIWLIKKRYFNCVELISIRAQKREFTTDCENIVEIEELKRMSLFKEEFFIPTSYKEYIRETKKVDRNSTVIKRAVDANVASAKVAATIAAGKVINAAVAKKITPQLPYMVKGYADTAIGRVVIANIADFAVKQFLAGNAKAQLATDAMMQAAMLELMETFDLESIVEDVLSNVVLDTEKT